MTYREQIERAEGAYQKLRDAVRRVRPDAVLIDSLRSQATRFAPLFPLIEAKLGRFDR